MDVSADSVVIIGLDVMEADNSQGTRSSAVRRHFLCSGADLLRGKLSKTREVSPRTIFSAESASLFEKISKGDPSNKVYFVLYPTRTYSVSLGR